jgi:hypothetical protein
MFLQLQPVRTSIEDKHSKTAGAIAKLVSEVDRAFIPKGSGQKAQTRLGESYRRSGGMSSGASTVNMNRMTSSTLMRLVPLSWGPDRGFWFSQ